MGGVHGPLWAASAGSRGSSERPRGSFSSGPPAEERSPAEVDDGFLQWWLGPGCLADGDPPQELRSKSEPPAADETKRSWGAPSGRSSTRTAWSTCTTPRHARFGWRGFAIWGRVQDANYVCPAATLVRVSSGLSILSATGLREFLKLSRVVGWNPCPVERQGHQQHS